MSDFYKLIFGQKTLDKRNFANRHLPNRHFARHLTNSHFAKHLTNLAYGQKTFGPQSFDRQTFGIISQCIVGVQAFGQQTFDKKAFGLPTFDPLVLYGKLDFGLTDIWAPDI